MLNGVPKRHDAPSCLLLKAALMYPPKLCDLVSYNCSLTPFCCQVKDTGNRLPCAIAAEDFAGGAASDNNIQDRTSHAALTTTGRQHPHPLPPRIRRPPPD
jgi:hypothetical protein